MSPAVATLVVGLGNPDTEHAGTRHNVGWMIADAAAKRLGADWEAAQKLHAEAARAGVTLLLKPTTYMNASGQSVRAAADFYKVTPPHVLVITDDINLPFGEIRFRERGGAGGHNGLADIIARLGTEDFPRLRIGVGEPPVRDAVPHVLGKFSREEQERLPELIAAAAAQVTEWIDG